MGIDISGLVKSILKEQITTSKRIRNPLFDEEDLDTNDKQFTKVSEDIVKISNRIQVSPYYIIYLFVRYAFPVTRHHIPLVQLHHTWKKFKNEAFDTTLLEIGKKFFDSDIFVDVNQKLGDIIQSWNNLAKLIETLNKPYRLRKVSFFDFYSYKTALMVYFYTLPAIATYEPNFNVKKIEDLDRFVSMLYNYYKFNEFYFKHLVSNDMASTKFLVDAIYKKYNNSFKKDPMLSNYGKAGHVNEIKRDTSFFDKIKK